MSARIEANDEEADRFPIADAVLRSIHRVTAVYAGLFSPFQIGYAKAFDDAGGYVNRSLRATQRVQVYSLQGLQELQVLRESDSLGSAVVGAALADKKLEEALALIGDGEDLHWSQLYNILEFLGGEEDIVKRKWATRVASHNASWQRLRSSLIPSMM